jgi:hypothetical protein
MGTFGGRIWSWGEGTWMFGEAKNWWVPMEATNRETVIMKILKTKSAWCFKLAWFDYQIGIKWLMMKIIADENYCHFSILQIKLTKINVFKLKKRSEKDQESTGADRKGGEEAAID